jgi:hypothetical protein
MSVMGREDVGPGRIMAVPGEGNVTVKRFRAGRILADTADPGAGAGMVW